MTAIAAPRSGVRAPAAGDPIVVRGAAFVALGVYGGLHWAGQVQPAGRGALLGMVIVALMAAAGLRLTSGLARPLGRGAARAAVLVVAVGAVLLSAGVPARFLAPGSWDVLAAGIGQGLEALPSLRIPYRGEDEWVRTVILTGGGLLLLLAAGLASRPGRGRTLGAAVALGVLYAVPIVEQDPRVPYLDGAVFALLAAALLWAERLRLADVPLAVTLVVLAAGLGMLVAPRVDAERPWLDYERLASELERSGTTGFDWDHRYGPLRWSRDGREMLRVRARTPTYWKAAALEEFDGSVWGRALGYNPIDEDFEPGTDRPEWHQELRVVVRGLRSKEYIGAGTTERIRPTGRPLAVIQSTPGTFITGRRLLRRGDTYRAGVYVPQPDEGELASAGTSYPLFVRRQLTMTLPRIPVLSAPGDKVGPEILFPLWDSGELTRAFFASGFENVDGVRLVNESPYGRMYRLAQRVKAASSSPYDFVRRVQARVRAGAAYDEQPPRRAVPLDAFLFGDRRGYCQHFSGAMALLLRMGGVPARVAAGFTPGKLDRKRDEYVVRDLDAHSWVEAYFPTIGWVPFDPTPADAPPSSQAADEAAPNASVGDVSDLGAEGDPGADPRAGIADEGTAPRWALVVAALALVLAVAAFVRARRARRPTRPTAPELVELERALRRAGRAPAPDMTLRRLEQLLGGSEAARGYLERLRLARYGTGAPAPSAGQRRALRRALGEGLGPGGRLRAWWALPPKAPALRFRNGRVRPYTG